MESASVKAFLLAFFVGLGSISFVVASEFEDDQDDLTQHEDPEHVAGIDNGTVKNLNSVHLGNVRNNVPHEEGEFEKISYPTPDGGRVSGIRKGQSTNERVSVNGKDFLVKRHVTGSIEEIVDKRENVVGRTSQISHRKDFVSNDGLMQGCMIVSHLSFSPAQEGDQSSHCVFPAVDRQERKRMDGNTDDGRVFPAVAIRDTSSGADGLPFAEEHAVAQKPNRPRQISPRQKPIVEEKAE
jgi:hypothetical protein